MSSDWVSNLLIIFSIMCLALLIFIDFQAFKEKDLYLKEKGCVRVYNTGELKVLGNAKIYECSDGSQVVWGK